MSKGDKQKKRLQKNDLAFNMPVTFFFLGLILFIAGLLPNFTPEVKNSLTILALLTAGYHVIWEGVEDTVEQSKKANCFVPNTHILMALAALGAVLLGETTEAALLIFIFAGAHFLEKYVEGCSQREITKLLELNPTEARRLTNTNEIEMISVDQLKIGDCVQVLNGGQVPADGKILEGYTSIDESTITGESIPCEKTVGDEVYASTINGSGTIIVEVSKYSSQTVFAKILQLVEASQGHFSPAAKRLNRFEPIYVSIVLLAFIGLLISGPLFWNWAWTKTISISLTFLVSASPCALAVSVIPATLAGISNLARQGVLFKGGCFLSDLTAIKMIAFDKTGTLTEGKPKVVTSQFLLSDISKEKFEAVLVAMESQSNHPLATAIVNYFNPEPSQKRLNISVEHYLGQGLLATYDGLSFKIGKPQLFHQVDKHWLEKKEKEEANGRTVVFVALNETVVGFISIQDRPQANAVKAINYFKAAGVKTLMLTGDAKAAGQAVGRELGIDEVVTNVLPEQKAKIIAKYQSQYGLTAMLGDGVNDAPALATADLGIAMGDGTDIAIETADIVLMKNDLTKLVKAHKLSKRLQIITRQNISFALFVIVLLINLTFFGHLSMVTSVTLHEGSTLIVLFNSLRLLLDYH